MSLAVILSNSVSPLCIRKRSPGKIGAALAELGEILPFDPEAAVEMHVGLLFQCISIDVEQIQVAVTLGASIVVESQIARKDVVLGRLAGQLIFLCE